MPRRGREDARGTSTKTAENRANAPTCESRRLYGGARNPVFTGQFSTPAVLPGALIAAWLMREGGRAMRFIHLFLIGYLVLLLGFGLALWKSGVLARVDSIWIVIGTIIAIGIGIMASVASGRPTITEEVEGK